MGLKQPSKAPAPIERAALKAIVQTNSQMIRDHLSLTRGLIDAILFLESSAVDEVDPDSAERCMENISANLLAMSPGDQIQLRLHLNKTLIQPADGF
jgi:hypothetical protein